MEFTRTQQKILQTAQTLILSKGYQATTVDDICQRAGVSKGSFYHSFKSKEDMGLCLLNWYHQGGENSIFDGPFIDLADPIEKMYAFLDTMESSSKALWGSGCLLGSLGMELCETSPKIRFEVATIFKKLGSRLEIFFEPAAGKRGKKTEGPTARELAERFLVMLEGSIILARVHKNWSIVHRGFENFRQQLQSLAG